MKNEVEKSSNVKHYQFWRHDNKPIKLWSNEVIQHNIDCIHNNPVEQGLVYKSEDYVYSSAVDYAGQKGLVDGVEVFRMFAILDSKPHERIRAVAVIYYFFSSFSFLH